MRQTLLLSLLVAATTGCATVGTSPSPSAVHDQLRSRTGYGLPGAEASPLPPDVGLEDGLSEDEAIALTLWSSPAFQVTLADLGMARADLADAGLLRNPVLSLLLPWGPKQFEWTVQFPAEVLWQRPRRVAAARLNLDAVAQRLVFDGLAAVAQSRLAFTEAVIAEQRVALAADNAELAKRASDIAAARLRAGDVSELEARAVRNDASTVALVHQSALYEQRLARAALVAQLGLGISPDDLRLVTPATRLDAPPCQAGIDLETAALATRPDVRAAEIGIEAAAARARWERSRIFTLMAVLDGNARGTEGAEAGPGVAVEVPVLSRNQGAIGRADVDVQRASHQYAAVRAQVLGDVRAAALRLAQAAEASQMWREQVVPSLEVEQGQAERTYQAGEIPLFQVLDVRRRVIDGRMALLAADAMRRRATIALERSVGRRCQTP